jgi:predicted nucleic acid-binding protein
VKVVSNAGPLIALGKLGQLSLLLTLYDEILIPREVYHEVVMNGLRLGADDAQAVDFLVQQGDIRMVEVVVPSPLPAWAHPLDAGEIEVIVLGQQHTADWVLIDNEHARRAAHQVGLPLKGTVGLLLEAWRQGHLLMQAFELLIQAIKTRPDLWISHELCDRALEQARQEASQCPQR